MTDPDPDTETDDTSESPPSPSTLDSIDQSASSPSDKTTTTTFTTTTAASTSSTAQSETTMLATQLPSAIGGHMFKSPLVSKTPATIQMELQQLKAAPILNPHFRMVQR